MPKPPRQLAVEQLNLVRARAQVRGYRVITDRPDELFDFIDAYGVEWELDTRSFANPLAIVEAKRTRAEQTPQSNPTHEKGAPTGRLIV
jgi:hypothetical protein